MRFIRRTYPISKVGSRTLVQCERQGSQLGRYRELFVDFTATPDGVPRRDRLSRTFSRGKKEKSRADLEKKGKRRDARRTENMGERERAQREGVKGESNLRSVGASERDSATCISHVLTRRCAHLYCICITMGKRGRNKHIKRHDSFTADKNMSRDTYLDSLLLISLAPVFLSLSKLPSRSRFSLSLALERVVK